LNNKKDWNEKQTINYSPWLIIELAAYGKCFEKLLLLFFAGKPGDFSLNG